MNFFRSAFLGMLLLISGMLSAQSFSDREFNQDRMMATSFNIMILSSFETEDHITAYSDYGTLQWDVAFRPKVISWKLKDNYLFVFSKSRYAEKTYLTCIDPLTGLIAWERP
ncbi:hypothetical protein [Candidatus Protochlamydia phocaeensis]|uniref:hypothetical protein n=1 Tax=Candidatus Protochlamydia phocaeensis TaxID=1414722 RepID=UPI0008383EBE|nr:hypothetical protein [Candidatus Protochlamydia phocaeensis]